MGRFEYPLTPKELKESYPLPVQNIIGCILQIYTRTCRARQGAPKSVCKHWSSPIQPKLLVNCSILPEQFATNRPRRLRESRIKKYGHRVFANGFQIRAVQCLLQGRVCSEVAAHLDFAQFQSLQNGNFSKNVVVPWNLMKKVLVKLNPTKMRLRRDKYGGI